MNAETLIRLLQKVPGNSEILIRLPGKKDDRVSVWKVLLECVEGEEWTVVFDPGGGTL